MWPFTKPEEPKEDLVAIAVDSIEAGLQGILALRKTNESLVLDKVRMTNHSLITLARFLGEMHRDSGIKPEEIVREELKNPPATECTWLLQSIMDEVMRNQSIINDIGRFIDGVNTDPSMSLRWSD